MRNNYIYQIYLFCNTYLLVLEDESIFDINLDKLSSNDNNENIIKLETSDNFFHHNLKMLKKKDFSLITQSFDKSNKFISQIELYGEDFTIEPNEIIFQFESITINNAYPSISPYWERAIDLYKKERVSYLRNIQIETLLN